MSAPFDVKRELGFLRDARSLSRRVALAASGTLVLVTIVVAVLVHRDAYEVGARTHRGHLVTIKHAIVQQERSSSAEELYAEPREMVVRMGFRVDSGRFKRSLLAGDLPATDGSPTRLVEELFRARHWRNSPTCHPGASLEAKVAALEADRACCSDMVDLLIAELLHRGVFAREVHTTRHSFAEFYDPELGRWVFCDPSASLFAEDERGERLSSMEVRSRTLGGKPLFFRQFRVGALEDVRSGPGEHEFFDSAADLETLYYPNGNHLFDQDSDRFLRGWPEPIRQSVQLLRGQLRTIAFFADEHSDSAERYHRVLRLMQLLLFTVLASVLAVVVAQTVDRRRDPR